jgi:hypothetical protein
MTNPPTGEAFGGADALQVELEAHELASGADKTLALPSGRSITIRIPPGVTDNMMLRLPGADTSDPSSPKDIFLRVRLKQAFAPPVFPPAGMPGPAGGPGAPVTMPGAAPATPPPFSTPPFSTPPFSTPPAAPPPPPFSSPPAFSAPPAAPESTGSFPATGGFQPPTGGFQAGPPPGPQFPPGFGGPPTSGAGFPTSGAGYPTSGAGGYPTSGAGFPTSAPPPSGSGFPVTPGTWPPPGPAIPPPPRNRGKMIGILAGVGILVLVLIVGVVAVVSGGGDKKPVAGGQKTGAASTGPTSSPTPATPPVSPEDYAKILTGVDNGMGPAFAKVAASHNAAETAANVDQLHTATLSVLNTLDKTTPPEAVKSAHSDLVSALGAFLTTVNDTTAASKNGGVCAGSGAIVALTNASSANQLRSVTASFAKADPAHQYKVATFLPAPAAAQNRRLPNGSFTKKGSRNGQGHLKIDNKAGTTDAAVSLTTVGSKASVFTVYVLAGQTYTVTGIKDGTYEIYLTSGADWDPAAPGFSRTCNFEKFADTFAFKTTSTSATIWTITLQAVVGGNAQTDSVNPGDFPG